MARGLWVIGYGIVQGISARFETPLGQTKSPGVSAVQFWSALLTAFPLCRCGAVAPGGSGRRHHGWPCRLGMVFAMNSSIHSYMVLAYTDAESVSLNVASITWPTPPGALWEPCFRGRCCARQN